MQIFLMAIASIAFSQSAANSNQPSPETDQEIVAPVDVAFTFTEPKPITDKAHPDYVRCRSEAVIGSLARKKRICMTNREWKASNKEGSKRSRQLVEDLKVGMDNNGL